MKAGSTPFGSEFWKYAPKGHRCEKCGVVQLEGRQPHGSNFCLAVLERRPGPLAATVPVTRVKVDA